ncbi:MAG: hypothetical protein II581_06095 [Oscillospiraceae bacterium]|nr:hypothetical protein [Oscillospiraceae bacterium]
MKTRTLCAAVLAALLLLSACAQKTPDPAPASPSEASGQDVTGRGEGASAAAGQTLTPEPAAAQTTAPEPTSAQTPPAPDPSVERTSEPSAVGVYLGVLGYGSLHADQADRFRYRFFTDGEEKLYRIDTNAGVPEAAYSLQNRLQEGRIYRLFTEADRIADLQPLQTVEGIVVSADTEHFTLRSVDGLREFPSALPCWRIEELPGGARVCASGAEPGRSVCVLTEDSRPLAAFVVAARTPYTPPVSGEPGVRTVLNLLKTAMAPVGTTRYVYGGGWNWQDDGAAPQAAQIGLPEEWPAFFERQNDTYTYKDSCRERSYYPFGGWNEYFYAGADCSGYLGWVLYNTMYAETGAPGLVTFADQLAASLEDSGCGSVLQEKILQSLRPGDLMSMKGHCWMCVGLCSDGSAVIVHSAPSPSRVGDPGGGVQLSALGPDDCEALALAWTYMEKYYPGWSAQYPVARYDPDDYCSPAGGRTGLLRWTISAGAAADGPGPLADPEDVRDMSADEVLRLLFAG